ncbi:MAG: PilZ domain-containing protein [Myxococcota bacterium]
MAPERRTSPRAPVRQRVYCETDAYTLYVQTVNMSEGGMFLRASTPPPGSRYRISFTDEEGGEVVAEAEPVWIRGGVEPGVGVRFLSFERGEDHYREFVRRHAVDPDATE